MRASLEIDLCWYAGGTRYRLRAECSCGIVPVAGPAAPALLRVLAGRPGPHDGQALLDGRPLRHGREAARHGPTARPVAALMPEDVPPPWRTSLGWVAAAARAHGMRRGDARARARQALTWVGAGSLPAHARRPLLHLDPAERQRVALARALVVVPGLLLLERPAAVLPAAERPILYATLRALAARWEMVVLLIPEQEFAVPPAPVLVPQPIEPAAP